MWFAATACLHDWPTVYSGFADQLLGLSVDCWDINACQSGNYAAHHTIFSCQHHPKPQNLYDARTKLDLHGFNCWVINRLQKRKNFLSLALRLRISCVVMKHELRWNPPPASAHGGHSSSNSGVPSPEVRSPWDPNLAWCRWPIHDSPTFQPVAWDEAVKTLQL